MARLYAKPKDKVRPLVGGLSVSPPAGSPGTLGGILQDASGKRFGLTCSHVLTTGDEAQQPSPADNRGDAKRIGACVESFLLKYHVPPLDPYDRSINTVDAALIELDQNVQADLQVLGIGALSGIASKSHAHPNSSVDVAGKEAGHQSLYIGGATMVHEFDFHGVKYGYANLFELKRASRFHGVTGTLSHPVNPGDSGAWVFSAGTTGAEWLGVVVAGDGPYGYAIPAELIRDWIANKRRSDRCRFRRADDRGGARRRRGRGRTSTAWGRGGLRPLRAGSRRLGTPDPPAIVGSDRGT